MLSPLIRTPKDAALLHNMMIVVTLPRVNSFIRFLLSVSR